MNGNIMSTLKYIVWERVNKGGTWCPYSGEVCQLLEQSYRKKLNSVQLGDVDVDLKIYSINFKDMLQVSETNGFTTPVRRRLCDENSSAASFVMWQWRGDKHGSWHLYSTDVADVIENAFKMGNEELDLGNYFLHYPYKICFQSMVQKNKKTKYHRPIKRINTAPYPIIKLENGDCEMPASEVVESLTASDASVGACAADKSPQKTCLVKKVSNLWNKLTKSTDSDTSPSSDESPKLSMKKKQCTKQNTPVMMETENDINCAENGISNSVPCTTDPALGNSDAQDLSTKFATVGGKPWKTSWPPSTPHYKIKPVPGIEPLPTADGTSKKKGKTKKVTSTADNQFDVMDEFTKEVTLSPLENDEEQVCIICCESLSDGSSYDDDPTLVKLTLCSHMFHKSCIQAMYESGSKNNHLQCPTCKTIHGVKCGIQPPGQMVYHVLPYSLPGYADCKTVRIIYDIPSGIQGPEHPHPGRHYTARGFPRHCFLPDNEMGRKVLRLLVKAWERKLIFTIGTSSTTGEENTVTWNEIHHKTEFGCNRRGHGFPDPNYFENILAELSAHGVTESTYSWEPV